MQNYMRLPGGAVCTAVEATEADLKGVTPHYARIFIPAGARVVITVEIVSDCQSVIGGEIIHTAAADKQVVFDGAILPESKKAGVLEIRLRRHADVAAAPVEPKEMTKAEAELGM